MKKIARSVLWAIFIAYCLVVVYMAFLSRGFRTQYSYAHYFRYFTNFVPFKTISGYITMYGKGFQALSIYNLLGNFVLFLPMGMLLPCVFSRLERFWKLALCIFIMVVSVEITQFVLRVGIIDVDDVIFNVSGAMIGYGIIKIPFINKLLKIINFIDDGEVRSK
jgi:glycopeptide antibiotics resistance protein